MAQETASKASTKKFPYADYAAIITALQDPKGAGLSRRSALIAVAYLLGRKSEMPADPVAYIQDFHMYPPLWASLQRTTEISFCNWLGRYELPKIEHTELQTAISELERSLETAARAS